MGVNKHILLISYTFPPYPGVGGRRWAKFAKQLSQLGYTIHVIQAKNVFPETSLWMEDIENDANIKRYQLKSYYPKVLSTKPKSISQKLHYKLSFTLLKLFTKGSYYDKGFFWKKSMLSTSKYLIEEYNIQNVIVSCAPFSCAYYALELKKKFKKLNLVVDLRDPWTWGSGYGFATLSSKRMNYELKLEASVIEQANSVLVPVKVMKDHLALKYTNYASKISILPHAFDKDEITLNKENVKDKITVVFYGTLYDGIKEYFTELSTAISKTNAHIILDIYSDTTTYSEIFSKDGILNTKVFYHGLLPTSNLFKKIAAANFVLFIHPDRGIDNISTKFYEIIFSKTPIIYISKPGLASQYIEKNKIGYFLQLKEIQDKFENIMNGNLPYKYNVDFSVEEFSFEEVTKQLTLKYLV